MNGRWHWFIFVFGVVLTGTALLRDAHASGTECDRVVRRTGVPGSWTYTASICAGDCATPPCHEAQAGGSNEYYCECGNGAIMQWCYKRVIKDGSGTVIGAYCRTNVCSLTCPSTWTENPPGTETLTCPCQS